MAAFLIPEGVQRYFPTQGVQRYFPTQGVQRYFPTQIDPSQLWVNYNSKADSLTIYFTGKPVPSIWTDVDAYAYIGFAEENNASVTGLMIEHFSKWLLVSTHAQSQLQPA